MFQTLKLYLKVLSQKPAQEHRDDCVECSVDCDRFTSQTLAPKTPGSKNFMLQKPITFYS